MLRKIIIGSIIIICIFLAFRYCEFKKEETATITEQTNLIQAQIKNVGKLVVTEGHFAEVVTYKDQQKYLNFIPAEKKAVVIVNADVTVSYDMSHIEYDIDEANKTITIKNIPKEEIKISPELKFYDVQQSTFNEFTGSDYNKINASVKAGLAKKIEKSTLKSNAKNRLLSELSKILILTNTMGWKLQYNNQAINSNTALEQQLLP